MQTARTIQSTSKDRISNLEDSNVNSNLENMFYVSMCIGATKASQGTHSVLHLSNCWDVFSGQSTHIPYSSNAREALTFGTFTQVPNHLAWIKHQQKYTTTWQQNCQEFWLLSHQSHVRAICQPNKKTYPKNGEVPFSCTPTIPSQWSLPPDRYLELYPRPMPCRGSHEDVS